MLVTASGSTPNYTFAWDGGLYTNNNLLTGMPAGAHAIHVSDAHSCHADSTITLTQPTQLYFGASLITTPTCEGYKDGSISVTGAGGTPSYLYSVDNVTYGTHHVYIHLPEAPYHYYVKDSNLCVHDTIIDLIGYPHIVIGSVDATDPSCHGFKDGQVVLNVTGGNQPLTYYLVKPAVNNQTGIFDSLKKGYYQFHIQDVTGCSKDTAATLGEPDTLIVTTVVTPNDCVGLDNGGGIKTTVTGGTQPYNYQWSDRGESTTADLTGISNGHYFVRVTDAHQCLDSNRTYVGYDDCCKPFIPDAFTPNGDGVNDVFRVRWKGDVSGMEFSVFNRFGQRVFVTYTNTGAWDGTFNGVPCDMGTYFYYVTFFCGNKADHRVEYKGDVTLIR